MYAIKNKLLFNIIIVLVAITINASKVPLLELSIGDIVDINDFEEFSTETFGNILEGYKAVEFTKTEHLISIHYTAVKKEKCVPLKSLVSYSYPEIINDDTEAEPLKLFNSTDRLKYNYFGIGQSYIDDKYLYGIIRLCKTRKIQNLNIPILAKGDISFNNNQIKYKLLLDETAVLRFRGNKSTHFVTSITTGECLSQVHVNKAEMCELHAECQEKINLEDHFFETSVHKGRVITASNSRDLENKINGDLNESVKSLIDLIHDPTKFSSIFGLLGEHTVIHLKLHSLPELPESQTTLVLDPITHKTPMKYLIPGDIVNVDDLKNFSSSIVVDNILVDVYDGTVNSSTSIVYTDCFKYDDNDAPKLDYVTYQTYSHYPAESFYKFDVFDEMVKRKDYGVDRKYLNNNYRCMKITVCSELERRKLIIPSVRVINLSERNIYYSYIFKNENIVFRYKINNETHYVARTEKGNCLFQALVFPNDDDNLKYKNSPLLYIGKIISATDDPVLEKWAEYFVSNLTITTSKTLIAAINDPAAKASFFSQLFLSNRGTTQLNIYLDRLY
ncbi:uncharacterized protein LOC130674527 [Microplitis mediator]|uniref:uncharacterized protein LOC130674527 n=1 Tax=Microplitis mediator TaxID=375433 RepID=UPI0025575337|nr:uncharacterized protein LOC130674527 [Microplitis mediator]